MTALIATEKPGFRRMARSRPPSVPEGKITLAAPPKLEQSQQGVTGWLQYLFPVVGSLGAMLFIANNPKPLYLVSGLFFMVGSVGMGVGLAAQQRSTASRRTRAARARYLEYLDGVGAQLGKTRDAQLAASAWRHPAPAALLSLARSPARVWERRKEDVDFLQLRAGHGMRALATPLEPLAPDGPTQHPDPVCAVAMEALVAASGNVDDAIAIDFAASRVVSIVGPREERLGLARALLCQLAVFHAPQDIGLTVSAAPKSASDWDWVKWLPHARNVQAERGIEVVDGGELAQGRPAKGTTQLVLAGHPAQEPGDVDVRIRIGDGRIEVEQLDQAAEVSGGEADHLGPHGAEAVARLLAPLRLAEANSGRTLASDISLPSLLRIDDLGALSPAESWRPRPLSETLSVPIGVSSAGDELRLDLKESALGGDGPHGLVIGATGSGKSELLRTLVTGLAITHPPDRLAFVLVDFKGGAAFAGLSALPHVAGVITNLADDLALVDRMHAALFGEIRRRQELLRAAGNVATVRDYHRKLDAGEALEPLPYLLVIVDEFGELLTARPDFIDLFVAIGRLGRSLGMHLLLASQQLDEGRLRGLEGHLSYRIALRTFSAAESRTVLGTPDAYELPPLPGSGYLKVGTSVYTRFRAAVVSQPYTPRAATESVARARPFHLEPRKPDVDTARPIREPASETTVMDIAVERMRDAAPRAHQVWLPPLEPRVSLGAVLSAFALHPGPLAHGQGEKSLVVPIGLVDRPGEQSRGVLALDMSGSAGHLMVIGASLTGKTTLLRTFMSALALTHTPLEAQVYCIDFGGGGLAPLTALPHVGGVAGRQDPERVRRTVTEVAAMLDERESRFASAGVDSPKALRTLRAQGAVEGAAWADVFLVVDNWPAVRQEFEDLEAPLQEIAARGLGYGVHLVLTANRWIDVRSSLRESIGGRLELRLHDPTESAINRREADNVAKHTPGRGITTESLHFQAALPRVDGSDDALDQQSGLELLIEKVASGWDGARARAVLVLPRAVRLAELPSEGNKPGLVIGLSERDLKPVRLDLSGADPHFLVFGDSESGKTTFLRTIAAGLMAALSPKQVQMLVVDYRRTLLGVVPADYLLGYAGSEPAAAAQVAEAAAALTKRLPPADLSIDQLRQRSWWKGPEVYVLVDDYDLIVTPGGNPLLPLLPLLAQARDIGLHVVVARRSGGAGRGVLEPLLLRLRELGPAGLLLSGDPQEGPLLGAFRMGPQPPGRGLLVRRHEKPFLVQVAVSGSATS